MTKPQGIFYILLTYVVLQLVWWGYLIIKLAPEKLSMVIGEFSVFVFLLLVGVYRLQRSILEEEKLNKQQRNFLLSVTHELKSPLASIKLYLQTILKRDLEPAKKEGFIKNSLADIERLDDLVENMLMATKFEYNNYSFPKELFNLSELVTSVIQRFGILSQGKFEITRTIEEGIMLRGDRFALASAINNLVENACKYSPAHSQIEIRLLSMKDGIHFSVADQGPGIVATEKRKIFQKFYRSCNEETRETRGAGLGLFIVKQVADNHSASIEVRNNKPAGTVFELVF